MTAVLALTIVVSWGLWIPVAQIMPGVPQGSRVFYVAAGNLGFALCALAVGGGHVALGWHDFWLPLVGGVAWTGGNYAAFRASETVGLARASGTWTPLNIVVAFVWGALLFHELRGFGAARFTVLGAALVLVLAGVFFVVRSQRAATAPGRATGPGARAGGGGPAAAARAPSAVDGSRQGFALAAAAGVLWGSYFVPAQWAAVPAQVGNVPLALGILAAAGALVAGSGGPARLRAGGTAVQVSAGVLFGIGNVALLGLVSRVGTGVGFTIAQLSLVVNVSVGILVFKVPPPGSRAARVALIGIVLAGTGGLLIGTLR